jgi:hypothetical protein
MSDMTLNLAITINVLLDVALLGLLAFVISRASKLTPHVAVIADARRAPADQAKPVRVRRPVERVSTRREPVLD